MGPTRNAARRRRVLLAASAVPAVIVAASAPAAGQGAGLGGYVTSARASSINFTYAIPDALPTGDVVFQTSVPESFVRSSNGLGHALSSLAWPGPLVAEIGSLAGFLAPPDQPPPPNLPPYPIRSDAFHPQGPAEHEVEPAPGARMHTMAVAGLTEATGSFSDVRIPLVIDVGSVTSLARTTSDEGRASSTSTTTMSDIALLGGLVRISELSSVLEATTDGTTATAEAHTDIGRVTFAGLEVSIDQDGIHLVERDPGDNEPGQEVTGEVPFGDVVEGADPLVDPLSEGFRQLIEETQGGFDAFAEQSGISIRQLPDVVTEEGGRSQASAGGIQIEIFYDGRESPVISDVLDEVPFEEIPGDYEFLPEGFPRPPLTPQAIALMFRETHIFTITLANGDVTVSASEGFEFTPAPAIPPVAFDGSGSATATTTGRIGSVGQAPTADVESAPVVASGGGVTFAPAGIVRGLANTWLLVLFVLGAGWLVRAGARRLAEDALGPASGGR